MEEKLNAIQSLIGVLNSPIAQRKGVTISPEHCKIWVEELSKFMQESGWHPGSELPVIPEGEDKVEVYCLVHGKGLTVLVPMKLHYTISRGFGVSESIEIKWWSYPPKEE